MVGDPHHEVHVVLDEQNRQVALVAEAQHEVAELLDLLVVEPAGGLVEEQQGRLGDQRAGDLDTLLRAVRQGRGGEPRAIGEADDVERFEGLLLPHPAAAGVPADEDVLEHGHRAEEVDVLEGARDPAAHDSVGRRLEQRRPVELHLSLVRRVEPRDDVERRRLAGAVRADQPGHDPLGDLERDAVEGDNAAESERDVPDRKEHRRRILRAPSRRGGPSLEAGYGRRGAPTIAAPTAPTSRSAPAVTNAAVTSRWRSCRPTRDPSPL